MKLGGTLGLLGLLYQSYGKTQQGKATAAN